MEIPGFFGRESELSWLRGLWDGCTARDAQTGRFAGGPRMGVILAESGIGKSRLVQALYQQLTRDPVWDPPEVDYWPDAFNDQGMQLRVVPDMKGHVSKGPPRFAWIGTRWQPTDLRNASDRVSALPELRSSMMVHAEILRQHGSAWSDATGRIREALRREGKGELLDQAADALASNLGIPFGGLLAKLAKGAMDMAKDRCDGPRSVERIEDTARKTLVDEVCECVHALMHGPRGVPVVMWLDDAQWIDPETQAFLRRTWMAACHHRWPLLVVVTHWEREWRELLKRPEGERGLAELSGTEGVEERQLDPAPSKPLLSYLQEHLPGLTPAQRDLMLDKAAGNFLLMTLNAGKLKGEPSNFVDRDVRQALSPQGERMAQKWPANLPDLVRMRFQELGEDVRDLLGWGSQMGMSFLSEVVEEFARRHAHHVSVRKVMDDCVDPLAILGRPSEMVREFRHGLFHALASERFHDYSSHLKEPLESVLREHLCAWVNNSFGDDGNEIWPDSEEGVEAPYRSVTGLSNEEARDLLGMAVRSLPLSSDPDWQNPEHVAALRARYLLVVVDWLADLWDRIRETCVQLERVQWASLPSRVLARDNLGWLATQAETAGALQTALGIRLHTLEMAREAAKSRTPESRRDVSVSLDIVAGIEEARGDLDSALARYKESLAIARQLDSELGTPQSRRDVSVSLSNVAGIEQVRGHLDSALAKFTESLEIRRKLEQELGTRESCRDVSVSLNNVAGIEEARGDLGSALQRYQESLEIARQLKQELGTPASRRDVSISLDKVAGIEEARGDLGSALTRYQECLEIARLLAQELGTPKSRRDVSISLNNVAGIEEARGNLGSALQRYQESLEIARQLKQELGTPASRRDVSVAMARVAGIEEQYGDFEAARQRHLEVLNYFRQLAEELGTPQSWADVGATLNKVAGLDRELGDLDLALARYQESLEIRRRLAEELGTPGSWHDMSWALNGVAGIEEQFGNLVAAQKKHEESLAIARRLAQSRDTPQSQVDVLQSLYRLGVIEEALGERDMALARYEEMLAIAHDQVETVGTPQSRRQYSICLNNKARIEHACGNYSSAIAQYEESLSIRRALAEELGTPQSRRDVAEGLNNLGVIDEARGDLNSALVRYTESLVIARELAHELGTWESRRDLGVDLGHVGRIEERRGDLDSALIKYEECLQISRKCAEELDTPASRRDVSIGLEQVGRVLFERGEFRSAQVRFVESLAIAREVAEELGTPESRRDVGIGLIRVGMVEQGQGDQRLALSRYEESLQITRKLAHELRTPQSLQDMSASLSLAGLAEAELGDLESALSKCSESLEITRNLEAELRTRQSRHNLYASLVCVGKILKARGDRVGARARFREAREIQRSLGEGDSALGRCLRLALMPAVWIVSLYMRATRPDLTDRAPGR